MLHPVHLGRLNWMYSNGAPSDFLTHIRSLRSHCTKSSLMARSIFSWLPFHQKDGCRITRCILEGWDHLWKKVKQVFDFSRGLNSLRILMSCTSFKRKKLAWGRLNKNVFHQNECGKMQLSLQAASAQPKQSYLTASRLYCVKIPCTILIYIIMKSKLN